MSWADWGTVGGGLALLLTGGGGGVLLKHVLDRGGKRRAERERARKDLEGLALEYQALIVDYWCDDGTVMSEAQRSSTEAKCAGLRTRIDDQRRAWTEGASREERLRVEVKFAEMVEAAEGGSFQDPGTTHTADPTRATQAAVMTGRFIESLKRIG